MSEIKIKCVDQVLAFENMPIITAGDQNVDQVKFDFCPLWDGFVKVAVFFQQKTECSYALINADGSCPIPNSILKLSGKIYIAVTGTNVNKQVRTSNILSYFVDEGIVDASLQDEFPSDISEEEKEDIYNKILVMCTEMQALCQDLIKNFAYVRVEGANEFEYEESLLEAKIKGYTYTVNQIDAMLLELKNGVTGNTSTQIQTLQSAIDILNQEINNMASTHDADITELNRNMRDMESAVYSEIDAVKTTVDNNYNALSDKIAVETKARTDDITSVMGYVDALTARVAELEK